MPDEANDKIFIDADAFVSLIDDRDPNHTHALSRNALIQASSIASYTSSLAVGEAITVISQNTNLSLAVSFGNTIYHGQIIILDPTRMQQLEALRKFVRQMSKNARFTDMINMVLMEELEIDTIFSFDRHYEKAGFKLLSPTP